MVDNKIKYSKEELINLLKKEYNVNLLNVILDDNKEYDIETAKKIIDKELKREVK